MCFSPCSPVPSAKAPKSSESPRSSSPAQVKSGNENTLKTPKQSLDVSNEQPTSPTVVQPTVVKPLTLGTELKHEYIPKLNIIPSSPLPSNSNIQDIYAKTVENIEKLIEIKKSKIRKDDNVQESLENMCVGDKNSQSKYPKSDELENPTCNSPSKFDNPPKTQYIGDDPVPVIMKIEHIDENMSGALHLQSTQQFPVVTRKFRQLPGQSSKEVIEEAPKQAQEISNAQPNIAPGSYKKCETSEKEPYKYIMDSGAECSKLQVVDPPKKLTSDDNEVTPKE